MRKTARPTHPVSTPRRPSSGALGPPPAVEADDLLAAVDEVFSPRLVGEAIQKVGWAHRDRILTPEFLVMGFVRLVMGAMPSLLDLADAMRSGMVFREGRLAFSNSAFYQRIRVVPHDLYLGVLRAVTAETAAAIGAPNAQVRQLAPFALRILAVDDTTLDALSRKLSPLNTHPKGAYETLGGRLGCALDVGTGLIAEVLHDTDAAANEKTHLWPLLASLGAGNLVILDLGYFGFRQFDELTERFTYFVSRLREKTSYVTIQSGVQTHFYRESLIYLGKHRADRGAHPVRLVELKLGDVWYRYITNVLDPRMLPAANVWKLYQHRWTIEMTFAALKRCLGLAHIHPCHTNGVLAQVWSTLAVFQVLQRTRRAVAVAHRIQDTDVSWTNLMRRIGWYLRSPKPNTTMLEWLTDTSEVLALQKRGVRKRVPEALTGPIVKDMARAPVQWNPPDSRPPRQGKPEPRTKASETVLAQICPLS